MRYIKYFNQSQLVNETATHQQYVLMAYDDSINAPKREEKVFRGADALEKVIKYARNLVATDEKISNINIYKSKKNIGDVDKIKRYKPS